MLNFNTGGGSGAYIRFMPSIGAWMLDGDEIELKQCIFDLDNITTGWGKFEAGVAPEWVMDHDLSTPAPKPAEDGYKRGFKVSMFSKATFGDEPVREFATTGTGPQMGIQALYAQYEKEIADNQGKVPVVEYSGSVPTKIGKGNTRIPTLKIVKWVDRPAELEQGASAASPSAAAPSDDAIDDEF
jgi:hypothetical protein